MKRILWALIFAAATAAAQPTSDQPKPGPPPPETPPGRAFVVELRPTFTFIPKGFGQVNAAVPVRIGTGQTVNSFVRLDPASAILFTPSLLLGARFGENRHWEVIAGPNVTRGIHNFAGSRSGAATAKTGTSWRLGASAEVTRMIGERWGLFAHYDLLHYQLVADSTVVPSANLTAYIQRVNELLLGPKFRFGRIGVFGGAGPAFVRSPQPAGISTFNATAIMGMIGVTYTIH